MKILHLLPLLALAACSQPLTPQSFASGKPELNPMQFFAAHTHSWGVVEGRGGAPTETFETDATGTIDADGVLHWPQTLTFTDGKSMLRDWTFRQTGSNSFEGGANDVVPGSAKAEAYGNVMHLVFTVETSPGNSLKNVDLEEYMYREPDGNVVNRVSITKWGVQIAQVTEYFKQVDR